MGREPVRRLAILMVESRANWIGFEIVESYSTGYLVGEGQARFKQRFKFIHT